jgi:3'-phosphoadenosine 5'-phosphosulfate sulfotransferase (PAPS reductase)/FAD synthetase
MPINSPESTTSMQPNAGRRFPPLTINGPTELDLLESEAIHILREVAAQTDRLALLFSGGKDSIVLLSLAEKTFRLCRFPFPLLHIALPHDRRYRARFVASPEVLPTASAQHAAEASEDMATRGCPAPHPRSDE